MMSFDDVTLLFTDLEGSTRLWDSEPERMQPALARHDAVLRAAIEANAGSVVKTTGDGVYAVFPHPHHAVAAALEFQQALDDHAATEGIRLRVRCGVHVGPVERRDHDYFGPAVNRAARIMGAAHGGQVLVSSAVADQVCANLPEGSSLLDLGRVRLRDLANPERVYQVVHPRLRRQFPPLRSLESTPNNLPWQLSSFVGRELELRELARLLAQSRLLTLVGVGGLGKTRVALQLAADALDDYPDGVWFVELASHSDERLVSQAVATALGVKEEQGQSLIETLAQFVRDRQLLLLLDNCEHLWSECAQVARRLLEAAPRMRILATSREPLHVRGESIFPLPTLPVPGDDLSLPHRRMIEYDAIRLFVERAVAARPDFRIVAANAEAVADVCRRLDGIPLALELAAGRVRTMSVEAIGERLADRFHLLRGSDRTVLPRQQTLRACIDWSFELLSEAEQTLLRRLSVFRSGFTGEAAAIIAADAMLDSTDVADCLSSLVDKSLVELMAGGRRYRLLETVRQYADEKLGSSRESSAIRDRHLRFYVGFAEKVRPELSNLGQSEWLDRIDVERENLLSAHAWCDRASDGAEVGLKLAIAIWDYCQYRGFLGLGYRITLEALAREGAQARSAHRCKVLVVAGQLGYFMGEYQSARSLLEEALAIATELGDEGRVIGALTLLGGVCHALGARVLGREHFNRALALARASGDRLRASNVLNDLAELIRAEGDPTAAEPLYMEALALQREAGNRGNCAVLILNLARVAIDRGAPEAAAPLLAEALDIASELSSKYLGQHVLDVSAGLSALRGEWRQVARYDGAVARQQDETGIHRLPADESFLAPLVARAREALGGRAFAAASAAGRALSFDEALGEVRLWLDVPD